MHFKFLPRGTNSQPPDYSHKQPHMRFGTHEHMQREGRANVRILKLHITHWLNLNLIQITHAADTEHMDH